MTPRRLYVSYFFLSTVSLFVTAILSKTDKSLDFKLTNIERSLLLEVGVIS